MGSSGIYLLRSHVCGVWPAQKCPHARTSRTCFRSLFARARTCANEHRTRACAHASSQPMPWKLGQCLLLTQTLEKYLASSRSNGYYNILLLFIRFIQEKLMFHKYGCIFLASKIKSAFHPSIISIHEILLDVVSSKMDVFINVVFGNLCRSHSCRDNVIQDGQLLIRPTQQPPSKPMS